MTEQETNDHLREEVVKWEKTLAEYEEAADDARRLVDCWRDDVANANIELDKARKALEEDQS